MSSQPCVYLDYAATTPVSKEVMMAMLPYFEDHYGNPGSIHQSGLRAKAAIEMARVKVAQRFKCNPRQVVFTSGGTEANNLAILGLAETLRAYGRMHIIASAMEHKSVLAPLKELEKGGFCVTYINGTNGRITWNDIKTHLRHNTGLVVAMCVNNETGVLNDFVDIAAKCRDAGIYYHMDAVQGADVTTILMNDIPGLSSFSISGHKIGAPKGVGCLIIRNPDDITPLVFGGDQENGLRAGTENVPAIVGFGKACELLRSFSQSYAVQFINDLAISCGAELNTDWKHMSWKVTSLFIPGVDAESLILALAQKGVCISAGAACDSYESHPSHVLSAMGISPERIRQSVRLSFSNDIPPEIYKYALKIIQSTIEELRSLNSNKNKEDA